MLIAPQVRFGTIRRTVRSGILGWLLEADRRYHDMRRLDAMPDERLRDMGMTRRDAARAHRRGAI